jgi:hypothetical protein
MTVETVEDDDEMGGIMAEVEDLRGVRWEEG